MIESAIRRARLLLLPGVPATWDDHGRGIERNRRAAITGSIAALARVVQIGTSLITVPLTLKYLGNERFGLWMTISSVLAMASFADLGVGNGVLNAVAKAFGKDDMLSVRRAVSSGFAILTSVAGVLLLSFFSIYHLVNWADFFRVVSTQARLEAGPALAVFAVCFALNISIDVVQRVQLGLQQGYRYGLWQLCGSVFGLIGVLGGIWLHVSLPFLVVALAGAPIVATALNAIHFFGMVRPDLRPSRELVSRDAIFQITRLGSMFFLLQVVAALSFSADNLIVARALGAVNVPEYSIPQRMFAIVNTMASIMLAPLWPAYGEAVSRGHMAWVRKTLGRSLLIVLTVCGTVAGFLLLLAPKLIYWWVGHRIHPPFMLLLGLAIWTVIDSCAGALVTFLNGVSVVTFQVITAVFFGVGCLALKILFVRHFGIFGIPWATIIAYCLLTIVPYTLYIPRQLRRMDNHARGFSGGA